MRVRVELWHTIIRFLHNGFVISSSLCLDMSIQLMGMSNAVFPSFVLVVSPKVWSTWCTSLLQRQQPLVILARNHSTTSLVRTSDVLIAFFKIAVLTFWPMADSGATPVNAVWENGIYDQL